MGSTPELIPLLDLKESRKHFYVAVAYAAIAGTLALTLDDESDIDKRRFVTGLATVSVGLISVTARSLFQSALAFQLGVERAAEEVRNKYFR